MATSATAITARPAAWAQLDLSPRRAVTVAFVMLGAVIAIDLFDGRLGTMYSIGFVLAVVTAALAVDARGLFTTGVLPPVLLVVSILAVAIIAREAIVVDGLPSDTGVFGTTIAGVVDRGVTLLVGFGLAMGVIVARILGARRV